MKWIFLKMILILRYLCVKIYLGGIELFSFDSLKQSGIINGASVKNDHIPNNFAIEKKLKNALL
jgi:hypothetical protein